MARENRLVVAVLKHYSYLYQCYIHGDQLQGRVKHPGLPGAAGQGDVLQRGRGGADLHPDDQGGEEQGELLLLWTKGKCEMILPTCSVLGILMLKC